MRWFHDNEALLPVMGRNGNALSAAFSAESWAIRWHNYFLELVDGSLPVPQVGSGN